MYFNFVQVCPPQIIDHQLETNRHQRHVVFAPYNTPTHPSTLTYDRRVQSPLFITLCCMPKTPKTPNKTATNRLYFDRNIFRISSKMRRTLLRSDHFVFRSSFVCCSHYLPIYDSKEGVAHEFGSARDFAKHFEQDDRRWVERAKMLCIVRKSASHVLWDFNGVSTKKKEKKRQLWKLIGIGWVLFK